MIKAAAIRLANGTIVTGFRHSDCIAEIVRKRLLPQVTGRNSTQGFVLTSGYYVSRKDAMLIAKESGQVPETHQGVLLYSEDIFNNDGTMIHYKEDL